MTNERQTLNQRTQSELLTVDADTVRKMALNAERNPRQAIYGEATNDVNPITGESYEHRNLPNYDTSVLEAHYKDLLNREAQATQTINPLTGRAYLEKDKRQTLPYEAPFVMTFEVDVDKEDKMLLYFDPSVHYDYKFGKHVRMLPIPTTELFELHRALGRMEVQDGKARRYDYDTFSRGLAQLAKRYREAGLALDSITTPEGMNVALEAQEDNNLAAVFAMKAFPYKISEKNIDYSKERKFIDYSRERESKYF